MSIESNKAVVMKLVDGVMNASDDSLITELVSPNFSTSGEAMTASGVEGFKKIVGSFRTAFPDAKLEVEAILAEDDRVITWGYFTGTNTGPFEGMPPTGKSVRVKDVDMYRLQDGKLVESWAHFDYLGMMQQLGVLPGMGEGEEGERPA